MSSLERLLVCASDGTPSFTIQKATNQQETEICTAMQELSVGETESECPTVIQLFFSRCKTVIKKQYWVIRRVSA